jgi:hypothetical protein
MFDFQMTAPPELLKVMYECGLGYKNSTSFGMVAVSANQKSTIYTKKSSGNGGCRRDSGDDS